MAKAEKVKVSSVSIDQLAGSLRDVILAMVQKQRVVWDQMPEAEQTSYIETASRNAQSIIDDCLKCIQVDGGIHSIDATTNDVSIKAESIQTKVTIDKTAENCAILPGMAHKPVKLLVIKQRDQIRDLGATPEADPDQPSMFTDGDDVAGRPQAKSTPMADTENAKPEKKRAPRRLKLASN